MQYFTTCDTCTKLHQMDTDDYGYPVEGIGNVVELEVPDDEQIDEDQLCSCSEDWC